MNIPVAMFDGSYFPIHKITELEALTRSIAVGPLRSMDIPLKNDHDHDHEHDHEHDRDHVRVE